MPFSTPAEPYRPELHVTPEAGVLNAPAGILIDGSRWHIFHQYRPLQDGPYTPETEARWGHQVSEGNGFSWEECDDVLAPEGEELLVRAGSVVSTQAGSARLYFTSVTAAGCSVHLAEIADLEATANETSDDYAAVAQSVRRVGAVVDDSSTDAAGAVSGLKDFRSPCVVPDWISAEDREEGHEGWLMLAVTGDSDHPTLAMAHSADGLDWTIDGPLQFSGTSGLEAEQRLVSPRISRLRDEVDGKIYDVLLITVERDGIDISGYLVGRLEGTVFDVVQPFARVDFGHDFTRPRTVYYTPGSASHEDRHDQTALLGLVNGIGRYDDPAVHRSLKTEGWANALSLPRVATLQNQCLYQVPAQKLIDEVAHTNHARSWTGICDIAAGSAVVASLLDQDGNVAATVSHKGNVLELDRSMNPHHSGDPVASAPLSEVDTDSLGIIVDGSVVEVFADGGAVAMASRVYIDGECTAIAIETQGGAEIINSFERSGRSLNTPNS